MSKIGLYKDPVFLIHFKIPSLEVLENSYLKK